MQKVKKSREETIRFLKKTKTDRLNQDVKHRCVLLEFLFLIHAGRIQQNKHTSYK